MSRLEQSLHQGLRLIQVREKQMPAAELRNFASAVATLAHSHGARVIVNASADLAQQSGADGVHLTAARLMAATTRPDCDWCGASCHDAAELERARELKLDFVALGPVAATPTHPDAKLLGWDAFARLICDYSMPVYALGGLGVADLEPAWLRGGHGVAALRDAWTGAHYR
jgi:8-oxo-dGTP diphosphatase